jgi:putative toxin-antitoxin system antitoxin component (TIGR02293 family)
MPRTAPAASAQKALDKTKVLTRAVLNTASYLDIPKNKLARILGVSGATVTRLYTDAYRLSPDKKEWDFAVLLVRLFRSLDSIVGGSADDARNWLNSENLALAGKKPADLIDTTEGIVRVVTYLDACRAVV